MYSSQKVLDMESEEKCESNVEQKSKTKKETNKNKSFVMLGILLCVISVGVVAVTTAMLLNKEANDVIDCRGIINEQNKIAREFYRKIQEKYYELHPNSALKLHADGNTTIHPLYFNFSPMLYKRRTETAKTLLENLEILKNQLQLKKEESLTLELYRQFLKSTFGQPYENNYAIGDWMLGPNIFCWQRSCDLLPTLQKGLQQIHIRTVRDVELMLELMKQCAEGYHQRIRNLQDGIKAGIVLPQEACKAGLRNFKRIHVHVAKNGARGVLKEMTVLNAATLLDSLLESEKEEWSQSHNISIALQLKQTLVNNVGKSLQDFMRYLEDEYLQHCPPSEIASGLASLPIPYVYTNGTANHSESTTGLLPGGEKFNGSKAYLILLSHFTTYNITTYEVNQLAEDKLKELFPQVTKIAKSRMKERNVTKAIEKFRVYLQGKQPFYELDEMSDFNASFMECYNNETSTKYCPTRWKTMNKWLRSVEKKIKRLKKKTHFAFYVKGKKNIMPKCKVGVTFDYSPVNSFYSYREGSVRCSNLAEINIPFFLEKLGPKYEELTVMAHESYPGHHLEVQGVKENMQIKCDKLRRWVSDRNYFAAFSEGWATYVEKDVADIDMKMYNNEMERFGMIKHQILAALRAKVDVGFHYFGMKRREAVALYEKFALDSSDAIQKEITRLQSSPGQGTAYMVGENAFSHHRKRAEMELKDQFDIRDFHYHVLRQGELSLIQLSKEIDEFIEKQKQNY